jgi:argininosuccinate lyase
MSGMIATATFRPDRMAEATAGGFLAATDLADLLVAAGWPFRRAHEAVGAVVRSLSERGLGLSDVTAADLAAVGIEGIDPAALTIEAAVESKRAPGGTARAAVATQLAAARERVGAW